MKFEIAGGKFYPAYIVWYLTITSISRTNGRILSVIVDKVEPQSTHGAPTLSWMQTGLPHLLGTLAFEYHDLCLSKNNHLCTSIGNDGDERKPIPSKLARICQRDLACADYQDFSTRWENLYFLAKGSLNASSHNLLIVWLNTQCRFEPADGVQIPLYQD